jgi:hypothetical protein
MLRGERESILHRQIIGELGEIAPDYIDTLATENPPILDSMLSLLVSHEIPKF